MDYKKYKESLKDKVQEQLGENVSVYYTEIVKNNNVKKEKNICFKVPPDLFPPTCLYFLFFWGGEVNGDSTG